MNADIESYGSRTFTRAIDLSVSAIGADGRVERGVTLIDVALSDAAGRGAEGCNGLQAHDFFELIEQVMSLPEIHARRIAMTGLVDALYAPRFPELRIGCLAVSRFCGLATLPSTAH